MSDDSSDKKIPEALRHRTRPKRRRGGPAPAPRLVHGTRVAFRVTCSRCGADDTLPFVPRTEGAMLCSRCAEAEFGPDWARGREIETRSEIVFECAECGAEDRLERPPAETTFLLCGRCFRGEARPDPGRIGGTVIDRAGGVRKKKRSS